MHLDYIFNILKFFSQSKSMCNNFLKLNSSDCWHNLRIHFFLYSSISKITKHPFKRNQKTLCNRSFDLFFFNGRYPISFLFINIMNSNVNSWEGIAWQVKHQFQTTFWHSHEWLFNNNNKKKKKITKSVHF